MSNTWFTSDTHFGHTAIIRYCWRPFAHADEMDEALIRPLDVSLVRNACRPVGWNACVGPDDDIYHLGDFAFHKTGRAEAILQRLRGRKHFVFGNHDSEEVRRLPGWASAQPYLEISGQGFTSKIVLCHYAMRVWNRSHKGAWMLFGHSHGEVEGDSQSMDVGVDVHGYRPVSIKEIAAKLARLPLRTDPRRRRDEEEG